ncbi:MAG: TPM domain-containing protein [Chloroflexi bacterium]|nr:TPM domain-containing protein [Chloroflexota bacterium]
MRRLRLGFILSILLMGLVSTVVAASDYPSPQGYVNDLANVLSAEGRTNLESRLTTLEKETSAEVVIVTINSLNGNSIEVYSVELFEKWGIGKKGKDNGILFLIAVDDSEVRIEVGYGLEEIITDGRAGRILDNDVIPYFKEDNYEAGITAGIESMEKYIRDGSPPSLLEENPISTLIDKFSFVLPVIFIVGIISIYMMGFMARSKSIWLGGIWGIIAGLVIGFAFGMLLTIIILPIIFAVFGTLLDLVLSRNYKGRITTGQSIGWRPTLGGFRGPTGGSSSHTFGGFGGGRSGGGGAGRKW